MMENLQRILGKAKKNDVKNLVELHHKLMKAYGWIPVEEFKRLPIPMMLNLNELIDRDDRELEKHYRKMWDKGKRG